MRKISFPLRLVEKVNTETGLWLGRRVDGIVVAEGKVRFGHDRLENTRVIINDDVDRSIFLTGKICESALKQLFSRLADISTDFEMLKGLNGWELDLFFVKDHQYLLELDNEKAALYIAYDVVESFGFAPTNSLSTNKENEQQGLLLLLMMGLLCLLLIYLGFNPRQALSNVLDFYESFSKQEQTLLYEVLEGPDLDSGNLFSIFLKRALLDSTNSAMTMPQATWRDQQISWLFGQDRVDLPYSRQTAISILHSDVDIDEQRLQLFQTLKRFDRVLERRNIDRIADEVRQSRQQLIFGRMSRAFHNQATLFANSVLLQPAASWRELSAELNSIVEDTPALQASAGLLHLLLNSSTEVSLIQLEGACERFEEAVLDEQKKRLADELNQYRELIENCNDALADLSIASSSHDAVMTLTGQRLELVKRIREQLLSAPKRSAAYVVISQRPSPTGSHLLIKTNEFEAPYPGKADNLNKLVRLGGERLYSSPDYEWLEVADHWIEAIPLFIKEEVLVTNGQETSRTIVDLAGMEASFREEMADLWARNIRDVHESQLLCLAREYIASIRFPNLDIEDREHQLTTLDEYEVAALAVLFGEMYRQQIDQVQKLIESEGLCPFEAMRQTLLFNEHLQEIENHLRDSQHLTDVVTRLLMRFEYTGNLDLEIDRLRKRALKPRRDLPALHVLTTQSAGMTEGYIRTWLEESMALFNIVEDKGLHQDVSEREAFFKSRIVNLGQKLIRELGIEIEVEEIAANEQVSNDAAVLRLINRNREIQRELSCLGALLEFDEMQHGRRQANNCDDLDAVEQCLREYAGTLQEAAVTRVIERNRSALQNRLAQVNDLNSAQGVDECLRRIVLEDDAYREDLQTYSRFVARRQVLEALHQENPERCLPENCETYLSRFQRLSKTTARKQILFEQGLNHLAMHPWYYFKASGGGKRYHLIYTPSRVDLGKRERESVETWSQWVGGVDRAAALAGVRIYNLINKDVRFFTSLTEPEILKTGENASMVSHFGFSNALSLMVSASRYGDFEQMADLMNMRNDRRIHPAGEGYGGYCVPKDGLFLEFVLTLSQSEKLRQIGVPEAHHPAVITLANQLLDRQQEFSSQLEWEAWAFDQLQSQDHLQPFLQVSEGLPVFQLTRIAHVLENFGSPELRDPYRIVSSLAAGWSLHKLITGGEQVNRFMPFAKCWLIHQGIAEAARRSKQFSRPVEKCVLVLSAEYKPDTQDARFSAGLRKFEILTGTGSHLLNSLDLQGQAIVVLMMHGFTELQRRGWLERLRDVLPVDTNDQEVIAHLTKLFPPLSVPAEIRIVAHTGLSTQDLLNYTSDTRLEAEANAARQELLAQGMTAKEIDANLRTWGARLKQWQYRVKLEPRIIMELRQRLGGRLHALALATLGPERDYEFAVKGADVLDTGIPHRSLLELLANPARLCRLMMEDNPNSALVIVDGASGARHRSMNQFDVMLWFAAGESMGREPVYLSVGLGQQTVEAWREDMRHRRSRAERLWQSLTDHNFGKALQIYQQIVDEIRQEHEVKSALTEADTLQRFDRAHRRDLLLCNALNRIVSGLKFEELGFTEFLALGGIYRFASASKDEFYLAAKAFHSHIETMGGQTNAINNSLFNDLFPSSNRPPIAQFREEKDIESSNKAMEDRATVALETRNQLAQRIAHARALNKRKSGFAGVMPSKCEFMEGYNNAKQILGSGDHPITEESFGAFIGHTRHALITLIRNFNEMFILEDVDDIVLRIEKLFTTERSDEAIDHRIAGGYEDIGDFGRLAQRVCELAQEEKIDVATKAKLLADVAKGAELFYMFLAINGTIAFTGQDSNDIDVMGLWQALADFFAKTVNDHSYEYRPWVYSRGTGFSDIQGEKLYQLAVERHQWLYRYLRFVVTRYTELKELSAGEQDLLLGNYQDGHEIEGIASGGVGDYERSWRGYGQLREIAFIRNDGFPIPKVFAEFDPDLIRGNERVNHVVAAPVGRTHYSRALMEGPTLARQLEDEGRRGANLIITRKIDIQENPEYPRPVVFVDSGHLYLDSATYQKALIKHKGYSEQDAAIHAEGLHPKGIRVAVRFTRPVLAALVYPFHGDPIYDQGTLEACGLPYTIQSLFHTWTTYDKAKYQDIFHDSGVDIPDEISWLSNFTARYSEKTAVYDAILHGLKDTAYLGLIHFSRRYPLVMIKDAAESGGRNAQAFVLVRPDGTTDERQMDKAVEFIYQISLKHNVCIQEILQSSPEHWATEEFMRSFVHRQIVDWGSPINRQRKPYTPLFGSHRIIVSTDNPAATDPENKWHISHWITLNSRQLITNVGRGGTLEQLLPEHIRPEYRQPLLDKLTKAGLSVMEAMAAYESRNAAAYKAETGRNIGTDLMGVSYGMPRYLMLDFLIVPVFHQQGRLAEIEPLFDEHGSRIGSRFILQKGDQCYEGSIKDWRIVLIEPNIGVGLWDRVALREEFHELEQAALDDRNPDWERVGANARIVLKDLNRAGEQYLNALQR